MQRVGITYHDHLPYGESKEAEQEIDVHSGAVPGRTYCVVQIGNNVTLLMSPARIEELRDKLTAWIGAQQAASAEERAERAREIREEYFNESAPF